MARHWALPLFLCTLCVLVVLQFGETEQPVLFVVVESGSAARKLVSLRESRYRPSEGSGQDRQEVAFSSGGDGHHFSQNHSEVPGNENAAGVSVVNIGQGQQQHQQTNQNQNQNEQPSHAGGNSAIVAPVNSGGGGTQAQTVSSETHSESRQWWKHFLCRREKKDGDGEKEDGNGDGDDDDNDERCAVTLHLCVGFGVAVVVLGGGGLCLWSSNNERRKQRIAASSSSSSSSQNNSENVDVSSLPVHATATKKSSTSNSPSHAMMITTGAGEEPLYYLEGNAKLPPSASPTPSRKKYTPPNNSSPRAEGGVGGAGGVDGGNAISLTLRDDQNLSIRGDSNSSSLVQKITPQAPFSYHEHPSLSSGNVNLGNNINSFAPSRSSPSVLLDQNNNNNNNFNSNKNNNNNNSSSPSHYQSLSYQTHLSPSSYHNSPNASHMSVVSVYSPHNPAAISLLSAAPPPPPAEPPPGYPAGRPRARRPPEGGGGGGSNTNSVGVSPLNSRDGGGVLGTLLDSGGNNSATITATNSTFNSGRDSSYLSVNVSSGGAGGIVGERTNSNSQQQQQIPPQTPTPPPSGERTRTNSIHEDSLLSPPPAAPPRGATRPRVRPSVRTPVSVNVNLDASTDFIAAPPSTSSSQFNSRSSAATPPPGTTSTPHPLLQSEDSFLNLPGAVGIPPAPPPPYHPVPAASTSSGISAHSSSPPSPVSTRRTPRAGEGGGAGAAAWGGKLRWRKGELLGTGSFGKVYKGLNQMTGEMLAVKQVTFEPGDHRAADTIAAEVDIMKRLSHPNIVRYLGTETDNEEGSLFIFMEFVTGGSLLSIVTKFGLVEEPLARIYTEQVLFGLQYLHEQGIIHRDIKTANILVDDQGNAKLADFGASKVLEGSVTVNQRSMDSMHGTPVFMAPEAVLQHNQGRKSDVWSMGCTILHMVTGLLPWHEKNFNNPAAALFVIASSSIIPYWDQAAVSHELTDMLQLMLQRDADLRWSAAQLLEHTWIVDGPSGVIPGL